jgi:hypothetical protein
MPEHLLDHLHVGAGRHRQAGRGVPKIVRRDPLDTRRDDGFGEPSRLGVWAAEVLARAVPGQQVVALFAFTLAGQVGPQELNHAGSPQ